MIDEMTAASIPAFDDAWDAETLRLAFQDSAQMLTVDVTWAESLDAKVVAIFSVSSVVVGLAPALTAGSKSPGTWLFWAAALLSWGWAAVHCYRAYRPRDFTVGPSPQKTLDSKWLSLDPSKYRFYAIRDMAEAHEKNRRLFAEKAQHMDTALFATALEVLCLALAFFVF
jgi:hypothetical protein